MFRFTSPILILFTYLSLTVESAKAQMFPVPLEGGTSSTPTLDPELAKIDAERARLEQERARLYAPYQSVDNFFGDFGLPASNNTSNTRSFNAPRSSEEQLRMIERQLDNLAEQRQRRFQVLANAPSNRATFSQLQRLRELRADTEARINNTRGPNPPTTQQKEALERYDRQI